MRIGFTGTQAGMTIKQETELMAYLAVHCASFHHGDCIGADAQAHNIARQLLIPIIIYPPIIKTKRAFCKDYSSIREPKDYLVRNHDIVDNTDMLIACPKTAEEEMRSGTWATVRYARKIGRSILIINPK